MRRAGLNGRNGLPGVTIQSFDLPPHDLSRKRQVPPELTTILGVLRLPEDARTACILRNYFLDCDSAERKVLVQVRGGAGSFCIAHMFCAGAVRMGTSRSVLARDSASARHRRCRLHACEILAQCRTFCILIGTVYSELGIETPGALLRRPPRRARR